MKTGKIEQALSYHQKALFLRIKQNEQLYICESLEACAEIYADMEIYKSTVIHLSTSSKLRHKIKAVHPPRFKKSYDSMISKCWIKMGNDSFEEAWRHGENLSFSRLLSTLEPTITKSFPAIEH